MRLDLYIIFSGTHNSPITSFNGMLFFVNTNYAYTTHLDAYIGHNPSNDHEIHAMFTKNNADTRFLRFFP